MELKQCLIIKVSSTQLQISYSSKLLFAYYRISYLFEVYVTIQSQVGSTMGQHRSARSLGFHKIVYNHWQKSWEESFCCLSIQGWVLEKDDLLVFRVIVVREKCLIVMNGDWNCWTEVHFQKPLPSVRIYASSASLICMQCICFHRCGCGHQVAVVQPSNLQWRKCPCLILVNLLI